MTLENIICPKTGQFLEFTGCSGMIIHHSPPNLNLNSSPLCINVIDAEECGDGRVVGVEMCDDGNVDNGDGCDSVCQIEEGYSCETIREWNKVGENGWNCGNEVPLTNITSRQDCQTRANTANANFFSFRIHEGAVECKISTFCLVLNTDESIVETKNNTNWKIYSNYKATQGTVTAFFYFLAT